MGDVASPVKQLSRTAGALPRTISGMAAPCPLKPVFGGLPRADEHGRITDEPASCDEEERQIVALREPLSQFLKDARRFVTDFGTRSRKRRFSKNTLVEAALLSRPPGRRGYLKADCLAGLRSLQRLVEELAHGAAGQRENAGRAPRLAVAGSASETHFSVKELPGQRGFSERAIRRLIEEEPGVIAIGKSSRLKRTYRRIRIPAPAAERIHRKLTRRER
jgi:hypothetical protein